MTQTIEEAVQNRDLPHIYETYYSDEIGVKDKETLGQIIVEIAQEDLHEKIVLQEPFCYANKREQYVLRVLYELALGTYESGEIYEAKEQFILLSVCSDEVHFSKAMKQHLSAILLDLEYETFVMQWVEDIDAKRFYISTFTKQSDKQSKGIKKQLDSVLEPIQKLFN